MSHTLPGRGWQRRCSSEASAHVHRRLVDMSRMEKPPRDPRGRTVVGRTLSDRQGVCGRGQGEGAFPAPLPACPVCAGSRATGLWEGSWTRLRL